MESTNNTKTILLIDDDVNIRLIVKKLIYSTLLNTKVYTSDKGPEGLGLAYITKPDFVILDTTLPKYSGREVIDYIVSNKIFLNTRIIVLHEERDISNLANLGANYTILSKKDVDFPLTLIETLKLELPHREEGRFYKLCMRLGSRAIHLANRSDVDIHRTSTPNDVFLKFFSAIEFFITQILTSVYLTLFIVLVGRINREENIAPDKQELRVYRSKVYPAFALAIATILIIVLQLTGLFGTFLGSGLFFSTPVKAAAKVWDGGGTTNNWSDCVNWDLNVCPVAADTVTFNVTSLKNVTVDATFAGTIGGVTIAAGYTGTMTVARSFTITGAYSQANGTFNGAGQTISIGTTYSLTGGVFTSTSATMTVPSTFTISGTPTFNNNSGTIDFSGTTATITCNSVTFNAINFTGQTGVKTVSSGCTLPLGASPTIPNGITLSGTLSGTGTITNTTGTTTINSTGVLSGFSGLTGTTNDLTIAGPTISFSTYNPFTIGGVFTESSGAFTAPSGTMSVAGNFSITSGTFTHNSGTVDFTGSTATLGCNNVTFNAVIFTGQTGVKTVNSDCSLPLGTDPTIPNGITLSGTLSGTGTITNTTGTLTLSTGAVLSGFTGLTGTSNNLAIAGPTFNMGSYTTANIPGTFTVTTGAFTAPSGTMSVAGSFSVATSTFTHNSGTINFNGSTATITCNSNTFSSVTFTGQTGVKTVNANCTLPLGASPTIPNGITLSGTLSGTGTLTNTTGILTVNSTGVLSGFTVLTGTTNSLAPTGPTMNLSSWTSVFLGGDFSMNTGVFTAPPTMTIEGSWTITNTSQTFNAPTGTLTVKGNFSMSTFATFNNSGGTVDFSGGAASITGPVTYNAVNFNGQTGVKSLGSGTYPLGANPTIPNGISTAGTLSGTGTLTQTTGTLTITAGGLSGFTALTGTSNSLNLNFAGSISWTGITVFLGGNFDLVLGTFTGPSTSMTVMGNFSISSGGTFLSSSGGNNIVYGTFNKIAGSGSTSNAIFTFPGGTASLTCNSITFTSVSFTGQTGVKTIGSLCTFPLGANPTIPDGITLSGVLSGTGTFTHTTGTLTMNTGSSFSGFTGFTGTSNAVTIAGGTLNLSGCTNVDINGDFSETSGSFTAAANTTTIAGNFTISGGTFSHNSGTTKLSGGSSNIDIGSNILNSVNLFTSGTKTIVGTLFINASLTINIGNFASGTGTIDFTGATGTISCNNTTMPSVNFTGQTTTKTVSSNCNLPLGANPTIPNGINLSGTLTGTGTITETTGTLTLNTGSSLSGFSGLTGTSNGLFIGGATVNFGSYNPVVIAAAFNLQTGTFTAPTGTMSIGTIMDLTTAAGTGVFNANGGILNFNGNNTSIGGCNGTVFNLVTFTGASGVITVGNSGTCSLPLGANPTIPTSITMQNGSVISGSGTITETTGTMVLNANTNLSGFTGLTGTSNQISILGTVNFSSYTTFVINSTASNSTSIQGTLTLPNGADLNGGLSMSNGTLNAPSGTMNIAGALSLIGSPTVNGNGGTIIFDTTVAATTFDCGTASFNNVEIAATGAGTYTMTGNCTVNNFTMTSGTWNNPGSALTLSIQGNYLENAATVFGGANLTVQMSGSSLQTITKNAGTFSSKFNVLNSGIVRLSTAFVVTTQICQVQGGGSFFYPNGFAFTCAGGFTVLSGGTLQMQGLEAVTTPTLNTGSDVIFIGNGDSLSTAYTLPIWAYKDLTFNLTDGTADSVAFNSNITTITNLTLTAGTITKTINQTTLTAANILVNGATWTVGAVTVTNSTGITCTSGTLTATAAVINGGGLTVSGCTFVAPSGTLSLTGDFTYTSGTYTNSSGIVAFNGSGTQNISCGSATLNTVNFTVGGTKTFIQDCTVGAMNGTLGTINATGTVNLTAGGLITVGGATWSTGFTTITANAGITCTTGSMNNGSATVDVNGTLTINGCTFTSTTATMTINTNFTKTTGTFAGNSGIVTFDGGTQTVTCGSAIFSTVNFTTAGAKTLSGTCTTGILNMTAGTIGMAITSPWTINGLLTINGAAFTPGANTINANLGLVCSSGSFVGGTAVVSVNSQLTISGCTFTAPSVNMSVTGDFTYSSGTFTHNSGTITFEGYSQNITCSSATLNTATFNTGGTTGGTGRFWDVQDTYNGKLYIWGGNTNGGTGVIVQTLDIYDIATNTWTTGAAGGTARQGASGGISGDKMYIWGGFSTITLNTLAIYNITTNSWSFGLAGGTARSGQSSNIYNGKMYSWGGSNASSVIINTMDIYDIAGNSWSTGLAGGSLRGGGQSSALYNGKIYYWGGGDPVLNTLDIYDIASNTWSTGAAGGTARYYHTAAAYNGKIYEWGGQTDVAFDINTMDIYDIASNTWSTGTTGGTARDSFASTMYNGKIYSYGGFVLAVSNTIPTNTMDIYDIATDRTDVKTITGNCTAGIVNVTGGDVITSGSPTITAGGLVTVNGGHFFSGPASVVANAGITCSSGNMDNVSGSVDVNGTLTISGCTFGSPSGTMTISTNFTKTTGTFVNNSGVVTFDGGTQAVACGSAVFNTVNFTTSGAKTLSNACTAGTTNMTAGTIGMAVTSTWTYNGLLTVNGATFSPVANVVVATAGVTCSSGAITGGTATFNVTGTFSISGCTFTNGGNTINDATGTFSCTSGTFAGAAALINFNTDLTINGCAFTAPSVTMSVTGDFNYISGTYTHNSGITAFDGEGQNITCSSANLNTVNTNTDGETGGDLRAYSPSVIVGDTIYYWGGFNTASSDLNTMDIYNITTNTWTTGATGGTPRYVQAGSYYNGKIYYYGGFNTLAATYNNTMDIYTIATNTWSTGAAGGTIRGYLRSEVLNGKIYYWGGYNGSAVLNTMFIYDIAGNSWSAGTTGGTARRAYASALYNGKIYYWGGFTSAVVNTMNIYDIAGNSWSTGTAGGTAKQLMATAIDNGKMYMWGGTTGTIISDMDIYDIVGDTWTTGPSDGFPRQGATAAVYNGKIYEHGGLNGVYLNTDDIYNISTNLIGNKSFSGGCSTVALNLTDGNVQGTSSPAFTSSGLITINGATVNGTNFIITANAGATCSSGIANLSSATTVDINGTLTISGCDFTPMSGTMTISTNFTFTSGSFTTSGTMNFDGGAQTLACGAAVLGDVLFSTSGAKSIGTCTVTALFMSAGTLTATAATVLTTNGLMTINGGTLSAAGIIANAGITCSSGTVTGPSSLDINGNLLINGCAFTSFSGSATLFGNFTFTSGTFTHNSGTITLNGDTQTITCGTTTLNTLTFSTSGNKTIAGNCNAAAVNMNSGTIGTSGSPTINSTGLFTVAGGVWSAGTAGGAVRAFVQGVQSGGKIYVWGGTVGGAAVNTMDIFDIASSTWSTGAAGGTARRNYSAVLYNNKIYIWGGCNTACSASFNTIDIYDITGNSWTTGTAGGTARNSHMGFVYNDKMYIVTGFATGPGFTNIVDIYDLIGNSWTTGTSGGVAKSNAAGVLFNGKIYSWSGSTGGAGINTMDVYDIAGNSWSTGLAGGTARLTASAVVFGGKMYGWGGCTDASCTVFTTVTDIYDFTTNTWSTGISGGSSRRNFADVIYGNKRYATGNATMNIFDWGANFTTGPATLNMSGGLTCSSGFLDSSSATSLVVGAYTISGCSFEAPSSGTFQVSGNYAFTGGQIHPNSGTATLTGGITTLNPGCVTVTTCAAAFYNLTINKTLNTDTATLTTNSVYVANTLTITKGTLSQAALLNVRADGSTAVSVGSNGTWTNTATGDISLGGSVSNSGTITLQGTTSACVAEADAISITSTSAGVQRAWSGTGTFAFNDLTVQDQGGTAGIAARSSTSVSGNGSNWFFLGCTTTAPNAPTSLAQKKSDNTTVISTGGWTNETVVKFSATLSDTDNPDGLAVCVEAKPIGVSFTNVEDGCSSYVSYTGTGVVATYTPSSLSDNTYHWQARTKDAGGLYSATWVSYGGNAESATDFGLDSTAPTGGTVFDGTSAGVDVTFNGGSGTSLSANWSGINAGVSGLSSYDYSIGTTVGGTDIVNWTTNGTTTSVTATGLTLQTLSLYYFNVRTNDIAGNSSIISSNGQYVTPSISFSVSTNTVTFDNLNNSNGYSSTKTTTLTTSTNAFQGYVVKVYKSDLLRSVIQPLITISDFSAGSYAAPSQWNVGTYGFGYTSNDTLVQGVNKFGNSPCPGSGNAPCYAPFSSTAPGDIVADHTASITGTPLSNEAFIITYKVQVPNTQPAGNYRTTLIYSIIPKY